jgi:hypothetical protein
MRRRDREITDTEVIERIIREGRYCTLALADGDQPYAVSLSYGYDAGEGRLYFHAARKGRKLDAIQANPKACATIVAETGYTQGECAHPFESVVLFGTMRLITTDDEKRRAIHALVDHLEDDPEKYWATRSWELEQRLAGFSALVFEISELTAKRGS